MQKVNRLKAILAERKIVISFCIILSSYENDAKIRKINGLKCTGDYLRFFH